MIRILIPIFAILISTTNIISAYGADMCNLKGIPFGITMEDFAAKVESIKLDLYYNPGNGEYFNEDYDFGGRKSKITIKSDHNNIFYGFIINLESHAANRMDDSLMDDLAFATQILEKKYGKPLKTFKVTKSDVLMKEQHHLIKKWKNKNCTAYTGIDHYDNEFNAFVDISDENLFIAKVKHDKKKRSDSVNKAVSDL